MRNIGNIREGDEVMFEGKKTVVLEIIDEITAEIQVEKRTCYTRPANSFLNKIYRCIGWPLDIEIVDGTYIGTRLCSIWNLKPCE